MTPEAIKRQPDAIDRAIATVEARNALVTPFSQPEILTDNTPTITKRRAGRLASSVATGGLGLSIVAGAFGTPPDTQANQLPAPIIRSGNLPESPLNPEIIQTRILEAAPIIKIRTPEAAAARYGWDNYTKNPDSWKVNKDGSVSLKMDPKGLVHRVRTNGAIIDGNIWVDRPGNLPNRLPIVVYPKGVGYVDLSSGTFRLYSASGVTRAVEFNKQVAKTRVREAGKGTNVIPVCIPDIRPGDLEPVTPDQLYQFRADTEEGKRREAAAMFGADAYTRDWENWEINEYGQAYLKPDNWRNPDSGREAQVHMVKADKYTTWDAWVKAKRFEKETFRDGKQITFNAIAFAAHPTPPNAIGIVELTSGTAWRIDPKHGLQGARSLFHQVFRQLLAREKDRSTVGQLYGGQPGVLVLPICN